jgi:pimeloyl-ACP methyl ester carboxylesterase
MPVLLRNILAVAAGIVVGGAVNMALITLSPTLIPPPAGVDVTNAESLAASVHLFQPRHFVMPFLAHAVGTFIGALVAFFLAATHKQRHAYVVGAVFLAGGVASVFMIPAPVWFLALDLIVAYLPMAWLATRVGGRLVRGRGEVTPAMA